MRAGLHCVSINDSNDGDDGKIAYLSLIFWQGTMLGDIPNFGFSFLPS